MAENCRIGVLTSGGDAPGMNAAIRSVVRSAAALGVRRPSASSAASKGCSKASSASWASRTWAACSTAAAPFWARRVQRASRPTRGLTRRSTSCSEHGVTGLVVIGGDGSYRGAEALHARGFAVVGMPGTIDNDVAGTDTSIGFDTALNTICDAVGKVRDTASSHERTFVIEVMGRSCGILATYAGLACGGDCILVPEVPYRVEDVWSCIQNGVARGKKHSIIVIAEGAGHAFGLAERAAVHATGMRLRSVVLGHVQRGGSPSAFDRILASRMGERAVNVAGRGAERRGGGALRRTHGHVPARGGLRGPAPAAQGDLRPRGDSGAVGAGRGASILLASIPPPHTAAATRTRSRHPEESPCPGDSKTASPRSSSRLTAARSCSPSTTATSSGPPPASSASASRSCRSRTSPTRSCSRAAPCAPTSTRRSTRRSCCASPAATACSKTTSPTRRSSSTPRRSSG